MIRIIVGVNWGDDGKGKMVDYFARRSDYVARFQGGNNAGHTIENEFGNFKLHLIPSGIFYPHVVNVLGPGTVVNLESAVKEIETLRARGVRIDAQNYKISDRAVVCFPFHQMQDEYEEVRLGQNQFGSTRQGIGPVYADRHLKYGIQVGALNYPAYLESEIDRCLRLKNGLFSGVYAQPALDPQEVHGWALKYGALLKPHLCDTVKLFAEALSSDRDIILEGQLGALRDIFYGIYPYTTSSSTLSGFAGIGAGCFGCAQPVVTGVMKAFSTCVGEGPFVTEILGELAAQIRETAFEFGALTGRPRRIGHFDAVASRYGALVSGATEIALTKLDSLSGLATLKICTSYALGNRQTTDFPLVPELIKAWPVYLEMPGWRADIRGVRSYSKLPAAARAYVEKLEQLVQRPIAWVSVGPGREEVIVR